MSVHTVSKRIFAGSALSLLFGGISGLAQPPQAIAQVNNADLACYLHGSDGRQYDLSALCGGFNTAPPPTVAREGEVTLQTGDVQVTLRWDTDSDLDLYVRDPSGDEVYYGNRSVPSGGQLDVDANAACFEAMPSPVENVFWPLGGGVPGDYEVTVNLFSSCNATGPVAFTLDILTHGEVQTHSGSVSSSQGSVSYPFSLAPSSAALPVPGAATAPPTIAGNSSLPPIPVSAP